MVSAASGSRSNCRQAPVVASHSLMVLSHPPLASSRPSGLHATPCTVRLCPHNTLDGIPPPLPTASHMVTSVFVPPLTTCVPSGLQAPRSTRSVCPVSVWSSCPLAMSQSLTVRSQLALASLEPPPCLLFAGKGSKLFAGKGSKGDR